MSNQPGIEYKSVILLKSMVDKELNELASKGWKITSSSPAAYCNNKVYSVFVLLERQIVENKLRD
jgi:hypothetical protein